MKDINHLVIAGARSRRAERHLGGAGLHADAARPASVRHRQRGHPASRQLPRTAVRDDPPGRRRTWRGTILLLRLQPRFSGPPRRVFDAGARHTRTPPPTSRRGAKAGLQTYAPFEFSRHGATADRRGIQRSASRWPSLRRLPRRGSGISPASTTRRNIIAQPQYQTHANIGAGGSGRLDFGRRRARTCRPSPHLHRRCRRRRSAGPHRLPDTDGRRHPRRPQNLSKRLSACRRLIRKTARTSPA